MLNANIENDCCELCGHRIVAGFDELQHPQFENTKIARCCGLQRSLPYPTDKQLKNFYGTLYNSTYKRSFAEAIPDFVLQRAKIQHQWINQHEQRHKLDIAEAGCGWGELLLTFKEQANSLHAFELDPEAVTFIQDRAAKEGIEKFVTVSNEALENSGSRAKYDLVLSSHSLEHISNPLAVLQRWHSMLRENGLLFVEVPREDPVPLNWGVSATQPYFAGHLTFFNQSSLVSILKKADFKILAVESDLGPMTPVLMQVALGPTYDGGARLIRVLAQKAKQQL